MEKQINTEIHQWKMVEEIKMYNEFEEMKRKIVHLENLIKSFVDEVKKNLPPVSSANDLFMNL